LTVGTNLIRFTPHTAGTLTYTCWMGMISSWIRVDPDDGLPTVSAEAETSPGLRLSEPAGPPDVGRAVVRVEDGRTIQEVTVSVGSGYSPPVVLVQKGLPTRFRFVVEQLTGCNAWVDFPTYGAGLDLSRGELQTPLIPVGEDFVFQCGMAMLRGYVRVVPDLARVEPSDVEAAVEAWGSSEGDGCCLGDDLTNLP
jgi:plastocyanin domain-containing protein